tara:strand:- start:27 stop:509 length:483 start_codon:yes stop_codon:yes gene_type:complete
MGWFEVIKYHEFVALDTLQEQFNKFNLDLESPSSKGYPEAVDSGIFVTEYDDKTNKPYGYTTMKDMGKFVFVGNSYMSSEAPRGSWKKVVAERDAKIKKPRITLLNPKGETSLARMEKFVFARGGVKIEEYSQVKDIMSEAQYEEFSILPLYRYMEDEEE